MSSLLLRNALKCLLLISFLPVTTNAAVEYKTQSNSCFSLFFQVTNVNLKGTPPDSIDNFSLISSSHRGVAADYREPLKITFNQPVAKNTLKNLVVTDGGAEGEPLGATTKIVPGNWSLSSDLRTAIFKPFKKFRPGLFVSVTIPETFKSLEGVVFKGGKDIVSFIMDNGESNGQHIIKIDTLKLVGNHRIPLVISLPNNSVKHPVMIFVHGGGWTGGTANLSSASLPSGYTANYLCDKLGVAVVGVGYRCIGSNGSFAKAKSDIEDAVLYVKKHASEFNFDLSRIGICGESAGAPLSALIAHQDKDIKYYIGWNGIYDFVNDSDGKFGGGNGYGQEEPSAQANSALYHIRTSSPATLLLHGTSDHAINYRQSVAFDQAIKSIGGYSKLLLYEGQPHWNFYAPGGKYEISTLYQVKNFLIEVMDLPVK